MSEKRKVFGRIEIGGEGRNETPTRPAIRSSPSVVSGSGKARVVGGLSETPTARVAVGGYRPTVNNSSPSYSGGVRATVTPTARVKATSNGGGQDSPQYRTPPSFAAGQAETPPQQSSPSLLNSPSFALPSSVSTRAFDRRARAASPVPAEGQPGTRKVFPSGTGSTLARVQSDYGEKSPPMARPRIARGSFSASSVRSTDPLKHSITARPVTGSNGLLPPAAINTNAASSAASTSRSPFSSVRSPPLSSSATSARRPASPIRNPTSPVRPSPSVLASTSPTRGSSYPSTVPASPKRPSTSSLSSSSTTTNSSLSPELFSDTTQTITYAANGSTLRTNQHHRTRRRSQSQSSSISSLSALSAVSPSAASPKFGQPGIGITLAAPDGQISAPPFSPPLDLAALKEHAEAKVNRKILDLEITNASLLAINSSLERAKVKQMQELRDMRRKLRERSLAPQTSLSPSTDGFSWPGSGSPLEGGEDGDCEGENGEMEWDEILRQDEKFSDIVKTLESLNRRAKEALEKTVTMEKESVGGKVLNQFDLSGIGEEDRTINDDLDADESILD